MHQQRISFLRTACLGIAAAIAIGSDAYGQSLLEQLEKKVRDGLELTAPQGAASSSAPSAELPAPADKKTPPPAPAATPATPGGATSILEKPAADAAPPAASGSSVLPQADASSVYLGLDAESLTGGGIGAKVVGVTENSPAWRAGFKVNDVIQAIDGYAIANLDTMVERLARRRPGDTIKVLLRRGNQNVELTAVLQSAAVAQRVQGLGSAPLPPTLPVAGHAWMGLMVADLSNAFRNQFGLRVYRAAAVTNVTKGSPADLVNIQPGDAIIAIDSRPIESARELLDWMANKRPGDKANVTIMRGTRTSTVEVTLTTDPQHVTAAPARPTDVDIFATKPPVTNTVEPPVDAIVPLPPEEAPAATIDQLQEQLRLTRQQVSDLELRIAELEKLIKKEE